jgi:hypothetical protein
MQHVQWVLGFLSLWVKWPVFEAIHSPPSNAKVKNEWCQPLPLCAFMVYIGDNFILTFSEAHEVDLRKI